MKNSPSTASILNLWESGKDTLSIAHTLKTDESVIYNALARLSGETEPYRFPRGKVSGSGGILAKQRRRLR